jgi:outer membrane biosynthesis protein TonB
VTLWGLGIVAALLIVVLISGFGIYELQRIDKAGDRISALNDKVSEITNTLADVVIGTTKQTQQPAPTPPVQQPASTPPVQPTTSTSPVQPPEPTTPAYERWR